MKEQVFRPTFTGPELIANRLEKQITVAVRQATENKQSATSIPELSRILEGESRASASLIDDISEDTV